MKRLSNIKLSENFSFLIKKEWIKLFRAKEGLLSEHYENLLKIIESIEENINIRAFKYFSSDVRLFLEAYLLLADNLITEIDESRSTFYMKENDNRFSHKDFEKYIRIKLNSNSEYPNSLKTIKNDANSFLHYDSKSFKLIKGKKKRNTKSLEEALKILKNIHFLLKQTYLMVKGLENNSKDSYASIKELKINDEIYKNSTLMWRGFPFIIDLLSYENKKCSFCNEGVLQRPNSIPYTPYLECSNKECKSILSHNLNLRKSSNKHCDKCKKETKEVMELKILKNDLIKENFKKYIECTDNDCGWKSN